MKNTRNNLSAVLIASLFLMGLPHLASSQEKLISGISYAEFRYDTVSTYVEIYASVSPGGLKYLAIRNERGDSVERYVSSVRLLYRFRNTVSDSAVEFTDTIPVSVQDTSRIGDAPHIVAISRMLFGPADYGATVSALVGDEKSAADSVNFSLAVRGFAGSRLNMSDIELCSDIQASADPADPYYKNTFHVVPNPGATYGLGMPVVSYYVEIYGLARNADSTCYGLNRKIINAYGTVVKNKTQLKSGKASAVVEVGSENISDLPSGKYTLAVEVDDSTTKQVASSSQYFFVYNPYVKQPPIPAGERNDLIASPFYSMGEADLDAIFHAAIYLATPQQSKLYKKLTTVEAKRRFLTDFWAQQGDKAEGDRFNSWGEFEKRFNYANLKYKVAFKAGWLTDRGRVYIEYGPPDDIDRHFSSSGSKPYEIWTYNAIQGGVIFAFVDLTGFNDYVLVHSTKQGEIDDPDWQKYIQPQQ